MNGNVRSKAIALFQATRYPQEYLWFVFISALDLMMTWVVLYFGGAEVNALADYILQRWALLGMVVFKFVLVIVVICICEVVGHYRGRAGRLLARFAVIITLLPVVIAFTHLLAAVYGEGSAERDVPVAEASGSPRATTTQPASQPQQRIQVDRLSFAVPADWHVEQPTSSMRKAQFRLPGEGEGADAELVIYNFGTTPESGGSVQANFDRWCGQFLRDDGRESKDVAVRKEDEISGMAVHTIDIAGRYVAAVRPGSPQKHDKPDHRMLGSIIITPEGKYFLKLLGPNRTVETHRDRYEGFLNSLTRT